MLHLPMRAIIFMLMIVTCSLPRVAKAESIPPLQAAAGLLPTGHRLPHEHRGEHFLVLHDTQVEDAALRAAWLEETGRRFSEAFGSSAFALQRPQEPMVCLLFENNADFLRYAQSADRIDMRWSKGYYSSRTNKVALFGHRSLQEPVLPQWPTRGAASGPAVGVHMVSGSAVDDSAARWRWHSTVAAPTTHEAAHQLAFNTGLQRRGVMYPLWVSEGLATCFEAHEPDQPFGPGHVNPLRQRHLLRGRERGYWLPLVELVSVTRPPVEDLPRMDALYAQSWSLFHYLYVHRQGQLAAYLWNLSRLPQGPRPPQTLLREFTHAFGSLETLEQQWLASLPSTPAVEDVTELDSIAPQGPVRIDLPR